MTAPPLEIPVTEGIRSLEVRWIVPGELTTAVLGWFARFPAEEESREDTYLLQPHLRGLSVKIRGTGGFDVKVFQGSPGILDVAGPARGRLQSWRKWSFPCAPLSHGPDSCGPGRDKTAAAVRDGLDPAGWRPVHKRRRVSHFPPSGGRVRELGEGAGCAVELTEVRTRGETWWTLGFEATGPAGQLRSELEATAALVFAEALPDGVSFGLDRSRSYTEWLRRWPDAGNGASCGGCWRTDGVADVRRFA